MGKSLDLHNPKTFNEKLQWLKLYNRKEEYTILVDKYKVRDFIAHTIGDEHLIPLLGVWENADDIDFTLLPDRFVLKCNHNSGLGMYICDGKSQIDTIQVRRDLNKGLKQNYYLTGREWPYKNVPRRIIAEKYMTDNMTSESLTDYKFFCFNGYVDCVMVAIDRHLGDPLFYFFDEEWRLLRLNMLGKKAADDFTLPKPKCIEEMFKIASKLSEGLPFARIDLYECNRRVYFGEITFFPQSGFDDNLLFETEERWGQLIQLEERNPCAGSSIFDSPEIE
jgi:hypothetical protein